MKENKDLKSDEKIECQCICKSKKAIYIILGIIVLVVLAVFIIPKIFSPAGQETVNAVQSADQYAAADITISDEQMDLYGNVEQPEESIAEDIPMTVEEIEKKLAVMKEKESGYLNSLPNEIKNKKFDSTADKALYFGELAETYSEKINEGTITEKEKQIFESVANLASIYSMEETLKYLKKTE